MNTIRSEEQSLNPLLQPNSAATEGASPTKELTRKVTPIEETPGKEVVNTPAKITSNKENAILVSNEDLKAVYEKKRTQKQKGVFHIENAHESWINGIAITSDNKYFVSCGRDLCIKIYDLQTKQLLRQIDKAHEGEEVDIYSITLTPNNKFIISGGEGEIKVWDFETKDLVHHFQGAHEGSVDALAVSPDNKFLISGSFDKTIKIFDLTTKQQIHHFTDAHDRYVTTLKVTPDNKYFISGAADQSIKVFDLQAKKQVYDFQDAHKGWIKSLAVTSDSKYIVSGSGSGDVSIKMFDLETKQLVHHFPNVHTGDVNSIALTSDNRFVISGSRDKSIKVFDLQTKQQVHHFQNAHEWMVKSLAVSSDSRFIISGSEDQSIKIFDLLAKHQLHHLPKAHDRLVSSVAVTSDNKFIISGSSDKSIKIFDFELKEQIHHFQGAHNDAVNSVAVTSDSKYIISASNDKSIKIYDFKTKEQVHHFEKAHENQIMTVIVSSDDKYIISGSRDKSIKVFDLKTKELVYHFQNAHDNFIYTVAISKDNKYIISGSEDRSVRIFDLEKKQQIHSFQNAHDNWISSVLITSDNKFIISGSGDKSIKVFDFHSKQQIHHWQNAHKEDVQSMKLTSNDKFIISASRDQSIKVFDLQTKQQVQHYQNAHDKYVNTVAVTNDDKFIVSGSWDQSIKVFEFNPTLESEFDIKKPSSSPASATISIRDPTIFDQEFYFISDGMRKFSILDSVDRFLFDKSIDLAVSQATRQPELFVLPFRWTILHIVSVHANHDFIEKMPEYSQFKMPFLLDALDNTPLHYLLAHKNVNLITVHAMFRYLCDYLEDCYTKSPYEFQKIIESLTPLLPYIFQKIEIKTRQKFFRIIYRQSPAPHRNPLPFFGTILSESAYFCDFPVLTQETRGKIWNEEGTTQVEFRSNFLHMDYDISSQDMNIMIDCLKEQENEEIFKMPVIVKTIDYLWSQAETPLMIFFAIYSAFIIALSVYLTLPDRSLAYEIVLLALSVVLTVNEFCQIFHLKRGYLENLWNWIDLAHLFLTIAFLITRIADNENELARAWISTNIIILGYIRWISLLKIFKPTSMNSPPSLILRFLGNLIQVVITIIKDMLSFIIIIALIIVAFSLIFLVFNREAGYGDYLYEAYNVMYGPMDIEDGAAWPFSQKLLMAILAFFLNVVLLNLLISIMGDSYGQVLEMRDRTDALTRLEMIAEAVIYKKFFKPSHETKRGVLVYCLPLEWEEDEKDQTQELDKNIKALKKIIQNTNEKFSSFEASHETIKNKMSSLENEISSLKSGNESMKNEITNLKETILGEFSKLKSENDRMGGFSKKQISGVAYKKELLEDSGLLQPEDISLGNQ